MLQESAAELSEQQAGQNKRLRIGDVSNKPKIYTDNINDMCLVKERQLFR